MSESTSHLLRLNADIWSLIAPFLEQGDVIRLLSTGNATLTDRIRHGAQDLDLVWSIGRFMDLDEVLGTCSRLNTVRSLIFAPKIIYMRYWTPIKWPLLPSTLVRLRLTFSCSFALLRESTSLATYCPSLIDLYLCESYATRTAGLDLRWLPRSLISLQLEMPFGVPAMVVLDHFPSLPPSLETLALDLELLPRSQADMDALLTGDIQYSEEEEGEDFVERSSSDEDEEYSPMISFPALPASLTHLRIKSTDPETTWHLDAAKLPKSLRLINLGWSIYANADRSLETSIFDMIHAKECLPHLTELHAPELEIEADQIVNLIPDSVTSLALTMTGDGFDQSVIDTAAKFLSSRLVFFKWKDSQQMDDAIFGGRFEFPKLTHLLSYPSPAPEGYKIPDSVTEIQFCPTELPVLPPLLKSLKSYRGDIPQQFNHVLQRLNLIESVLTPEAAERLPPTLEILTAKMTNDSWLTLMKLIRQPSRLPNLRKIQSSAELNIRLLSELPNQLTSLDFCLELDLSTPNDTTLVSIQNLTKMTHLSLHLPRVRCPVEFVALLNHVPQNLETLEINCCLVLNREWPVKLPPKLFTLFYSCTRPYGTPEPHKEEEGKAVQNSSSFELPGSLAYLGTSTSPFPWDYKELPPQLSVFSVGKEPVYHQYENSILPPPHLPNSTLSRPWI